MLRLIWWVITGFGFRRPKYVAECQTHQWSKWGKPWKKFTAAYTYYFTQTRKCVCCGVEEHKNVSSQGYN